MLRRAALPLLAAATGAWPGANSATSDEQADDRTAKSGGPKPDRSARYRMYDEYENTHEHAGGGDEETSTGTRKPRPSDGWTRGEGENWDDIKFPAPGGFMPLGDAYKLFQYKFGDNITREDIKKRYKALAKYAHPDLGGSEVKFNQLKEARTLLENAAHDPRPMKDKETGVPRKTKVKFHKQNQSEMLGMYTFETAADYLKTVPADYACGVAIFIFVLGFWLRWLTQSIIRAQDGRSRMAEDEIRAPIEEQFTRKSLTYHPWRANSETRDMVRDAESDRLDRLEQMKGARGKSTPWGTVKDVVRPPRGQLGGSSQDDEEVAAAAAAA